MAHLITADDLFAAIVSVLRKQGVTTLKLTPKLDEKFEEVYTSFRAQCPQDEVLFNFSFKRNRIHGDSSKLRETLYAARHNNIVSLENPSFKPVTIKVSDTAADSYIRSIPHADDLTAIVTRVFDTRK